MYTDYVITPAITRMGRTLRHKSQRSSGGGFVRPFGIKGSFFLFFFLLSIRVLADQGGWLIMTQAWGPKFLL